MDFGHTKAFGLCLLNFDATIDIAEIRFYLSVS